MLSPKQNPISRALVCLCLFVLWSLFSVGATYAAAVTLLPGEFVVWDVGTNNNNHEPTDGIIALGGASTVNNIIIEDISDGDTATLNITVTDSDGPGPETIVIGSNQAIGTVNISGLDAGTTTLTLVVGAGLNFIDADGTIGNDVGFVINGVSYTATTYNINSKTWHGNSDTYTGLAGAGVGVADVGATNFTVLAVDLTMAAHGTGDIGNLDFSDSADNAGTNLNIIKIDADGDAANTIGAITIANDLTGASIAGNLNAPITAKRITGPVAIMGNINAAADITIPQGTTIDGDVIVFGNIAGDIVTSTGGAILGDIITIGNISGIITAASGIGGAIQGASITGNISVTSGGITDQGSITAATGNLSGHITVTAGDLAGAIFATSTDITGPITVTSGKVTSAGQIFAGHNIAGAITIGGDMAGIIEAGGVISGHVSVGGSISGIISGPANQPLGSGPDLNRDGIVDTFDFAILAEHWLEYYRVKFCDFPLDSNPGWPVQGEWAYGQPLGGGGRHGNHDPTGGITGTKVFGVNLSGDYSTAVGGPYSLTAGPFDCYFYTNISLRFARWLNTDGKTWVPCKVEASNNGTTWQTLWENEVTPVTDNAWQLFEYDIHQIADREAAVYIRWSYEIKSSADAYSGWNIDDIELWGTP